MFCFIYIHNKTIYFVADRKKNLLLIFKKIEVNEKPKSNKIVVLF